MMKRTIYINNQRIRLDASQLIQTGGEGMVFDMGDTAVKLYHIPTKQHQNKLTHLLNLQLPTGVLGPCHIVHNPQKQFIGFQMPKLPGGSLPFKQLASPIYWQKQAVQTQTAVMLLHTVRQTLSRLHKANIIVGDLNDTNLFFTPSSKQPQAAHLFTPSWLDVDSYQFAQFPCPVAMESFLDPQLYHIADFSRQPVFTEQTDWYAFAVLLTKSLLQVHPYGGVHHSVKTLRSRAEAKISVWNTAVTYPVRARHPETLSDDILHELHLIFERGLRRPFSSRLLTDYANILMACPQCGTAYPQRRSGCPTCHHQSPTPQRDLSHQIRTLLEVDGLIEHVALRPDGRFWVITRTGEQYRLVLAGVGGIAGDTLLFSGAPGYRFGIFGNYLVVNPP
ncbi:MAG: hypothetical protein KC421_08785, partial [Anaerolineales bacterium]|nr:hypothetical protein [Anaerolineales bacterium]